MRSRGLRLFSIPIQTVRMCDVLNHTKPQQQLQRPPQTTLETLSSLQIVHADPDPQTRRRKIFCKQELIVNSLQRFYASRDDKTEVMRLLEGTADISLRLIDWFVTNYSKQNNTSYILNNQEFLVYTNYKSQLKAYSKKLFDPFCRRERIMFQIPGYPLFQTTVGKLNFFRWAIEKGVLKYIQDNFNTIEAAMNVNARELQKARKAASASSNGSASSASTALSTVSSIRSMTRKRLSAGTNSASSNQPVTSKLMQKHTFEVQVTFD